MSNKLALIVQFDAVDKLSGSLRNIIGLGRNGASALRGMQQDSGRLRREITAAGRAVDSASGNVTELINHQRKLEAQLEDTNRQIDRQQRLLAITARADQISQRGQQLRSAGQENMVGGAMMAAPFVLATRAAGNFSSGMVDLQQKADLTDQQTDRLANTILRAAEAARQMPEDMRAGVDVLAGFGLDPRTAAQMIGPIGRLGTAMKVDIADGANAAFANLQNLRVEVRDTSRALDIMAASGNLGAFEVKDMARHFPGLTAQVSALGDNGLRAVGSLSAALQMARRNTGTSDEAANNVQNLLAKINAPGTIRAFQRNYGVDLPAAMARLRAQGYDTFEAIAMITNQATKGDLSKLGFVFEDMQAQSAIRAMIMNLQDYRRVRDTAMNSGGTVDRAFDQRVARDATVQWRDFMSTVSRIALVTGATLLPALNEVGSSVLNVMKGVASWAQANPALAGGIVKVAAGLAIARIGFGALQFAVGSFLGPFSTAYKLFMQFRAVDAAGQRITMLGRLAARTGPIVTRAFTLIRTGALFMAQGLMRAGAMMLANPVILAVTAIVLAVGVAGYLIWKHWDTIKAAFNSAGASLSAFWQRLGPFGRGLATIFFPIIGVARLVVQNWGLITSAFRGAVSFIGTAIQWLRTNFAQILPAMGPLGMAAAFIITNWQRVRSFLPNAVNSIIAIFWRFINFGNQMVAQFRGIGANIIDGLIGGITRRAESLRATIQSVANMLPTGFRNWLGIHSPSRVFMQLGGHVTDGLALGINRGSARPLSTMERLSAMLATAGMVVTPTVASASPFAVPASPFAASGAQGSSSTFGSARAVTVQFGDINITVQQQPGESMDDLVRRIRREIEQLIARASRGRFNDD